MRFPRILFVIAPAALALAGCGAGAPVGATAGASGSVATPGNAPTTALTAPPTSPPAATQVASALDLCGLLTADDLHTVLGGPWAEGQLTSTGGYCHWDSGSSPNDQVITATDARTLDAIKTVAADEVDMTVAGHAAISIRQADAHLQSTYVDLGGKLLILEFPTSSSAADDQAHAQALAEIAIGNL
jgi:hypothetical protein